MHRLFHGIHHTLSHPFARVLIALSMVFTAGAEVFKGLSVVDHEFGAHHGVLIFGVTMAINAIAEAGEAVLEAHESVAGE